MSKVTEEEIRGKEIAITVVEGPDLYICREKEENVYECIEKAYFYSEAIKEAQKLATQYNEVIIIFKLTTRVNPE